MFIFTTLVEITKNWSICMQMANWLTRIQPTSRNHRCIVDGGIPAGVFHSMSRFATWSGSVSLFGGTLSTSQYPTSRFRQRRLLSRQWSKRNQDAAIIPFNCVYRYQWASIMVQSNDNNLFKVFTSFVFNKTQSRQQIPNTKFLRRIWLARSGYIPPSATRNLRKNIPPLSTNVPSNF